MSKAELIQLVLLTLPYPDQIRNIDLEGFHNAIRFDWRGVRFEISEAKIVREVGGGQLALTNIAMMLERLIIVKSELMETGD